MLRSIVAPVQHLAFLLPCDRHRVEARYGVDGNNLLEIGIEPGAELGNLLGSLLDQVIVDPQLNTKHQLLNRVRDGVGRE